MIGSGSSHLPIGTSLRVLEPHRDPRGSFTELFRGEWNQGVAPVQWNAVRSDIGVLRGVHAHLRHADYLTVPIGRATVGLRDLRRWSDTLGWLRRSNSASTSRLDSRYPLESHTACQDVVNLGSERSLSVTEIVDRAIVGRSLEIRTDALKVRKVDRPVLQADNSRLLGLLAGLSIHRSGHRTVDNPRVGWLGSTLLKRGQS